MLQKIGFQPGINKQISETTAEGQWVDCDNVRFRYGSPEKIGGWNQLGTINENELTGAGRGLHHFVNSLGRRYAIIGTNRILYILLKLQQLLRMHLPRLTDQHLLQ